MTEGTEGTSFITETEGMSFVTGDPSLISGEPSVITEEKPAVEGAVKKEEKPPAASEGEPSVITEGELSGITEGDGEQSLITDDKLQSFIADLEEKGPSVIKEEDVPIAEQEQP
ncbi:uncharacterized protein LOC118766634 [Octopus sinensis]|uniref:Uncharacterized protein LOC118766634 n=1 Tax=Octopus sinensis TaxID=2607531 RepID=A0A7E6FFG8_9MOLL|nr:uncharacterized protein LOC118766634 [Octopus sinensis]